MTILHDILPGQIWLTYLRFIDMPTVGKVRPVVILGSTDDPTLFYAAKVTSSTPREDGCDVIILNWADAGLRKPSVIRIDYVFEISASDLLREAPIGQLDREILVEILQAIRLRLK